MARKTKHLKEDKFYFEVGNIVIYRDTRKMAMRAFERYDNVGKNANWLGKWNGKSFDTADE